MKNLNIKILKENMNKQVLDEAKISKVKTKLMATSGSLEGINKLIDEFFYGHKILKKVSDNEYSIIGNKKGKEYTSTNYRVIKKGSKFRFEQYE